MIWMVTGLALLVIPWLEFWLMTNLGLLGATVLGVMTAVPGWWYVRGEGLALWTELEADIHNRRVPTAEALDAMLVVLGGVALIVPGLLTDMLGAMLLIPTVRTSIMPRLRERIRVWFL